jgi:hypothetical protein
MFMMHNEDYPPRYHGRLVIVEAEPDDAPAFLALTYPYIIAGPSCGLNAAGLAFAVDSLNFNQPKRGMPVNYICRDIYASRTVAEAERAIAVPKPLSCFALTVASDDGVRAATTFEVTFKKTVRASMGTTGLLAHTNHVLSSKIDRRGEEPTLGSRVRLAALEHLLLRGTGDASMKKLQAALSSTHHGLLRNTKKPHESATIASVILDVKRRVMYVAKRGPWGHDFRPYGLGR